MTLPSSLGFSSDCPITFTPQSYSQGVAALDPACQTSIFYPAYKVVSILYSPPGNQSFQGYTDTTTNGTITTVGNSFTEATELYFTTGIPGILEETGSTGYAVTSSNSYAFTETFSDALGIQTNDNNSSTYNAGGSNADNHNLDEFVIWLNPQVSVITNAGSLVGYNMSPQPTDGVSGLVADTLTIPAITMEAAPGSITQTNPSGISSVPISSLQPQAVGSPVDGVQPTMPGLAAICKNQSYYPDNCNLTAAQGGDPNGQCGCTPSDFVAILQTDPLLNYNGTTYTANPYPGTTSPLETDASGASVCDQNPVPSTADCRYVIVPIEAGSNTPQFVPLSGSAGYTYQQSDSTSTSETLGESSSYNVGISYATGPAFASLKTSDTWTWTDSESIGNSTTQGNTMTVTLKTTTAGCEENVNIYEDTLYHTFAFQVPTGYTGC
ncbi:MAG: hypothetical protein ABSE99_16590 [Terracidiphilus sp.]|jgi:hypothetical protein